MGKSSLQDMQDKLRPGRIYALPVQPADWIGISDAAPHRPSNGHFRCAPSAVPVSELSRGPC